MRSLPETPEPSDPRARAHSQQNPSGTLDRRTVRRLPQPIPGQNWPNRPRLARGNSSASGTETPKTEEVKNYSRAETQRRKEKEKIQKSDLGF